MFNRLFVGNLSYETNNEDLKKFFSKYGDVTDVVVMKTSFGKSKGFGYVEFKTNESAQTALTEANNQDLMGRPIRVDKATERKEGSRRPRFNDRGDERRYDGYERRDDRRGGFDDRYGESRYYNDSYRRGDERYDRREGAYDDSRYRREERYEERRYERSDRGDRYDRGERKDRDDHSDRYELVDARYERGEHEERGDRYSERRDDRSDRGDRYDRGERNDRYSGEQAKVYD